MARILKFVARPVVKRIIYLLSVSCKYQKDQSRHKCPHFLGHTRNVQFYCKCPCHTPQQPLPLSA